MKLARRRTAGVSSTPVCAKSVTHAVKRRRETLNPSVPCRNTRLVVLKFAKYLEGILSPSCGPPPYTPQPQPWNDRLLQPQP
eukprot:3940626-Rhodomonas_salina.4